MEHRDKSTHLYIYGYVSKNYKWIIAVLIMLIGVLARAAAFGKIPSGFNQDEAYAAYEAYSLLNFGVDSFGYHNPCYFISWGSGMNVLESYLAIPFFALFGVSATVFRLPQLIMSCISLIVFYLLLKELFSENTALIGLFLLAVSPWNIMLSKWGLESNLAPAFLLLGFYFFVRGVKNNKFFMLSALMYGLSLYAYSITWMFVPIILLLGGIYILVSKKKISVKYILLSVGILFVLALPLLLFMLVNNDIIPEIKTNIISVPKLLYMRSGEIVVKNLINPESWKNFISNIIVNQNDGLIWNSVAQYGLFYKSISVPFIFIGFVGLVASAVNKLIKKQFSYELLVLIGTITALVICVMLSYVNVNKSNILHMFTLMLITYGIAEVIRAICWVARLCRIKHVNIVKGAVVSVIILIFSMQFLQFEQYYLTEYNDYSSWAFYDGVIDAVDYVKKMNCSKVYVNSSINFATVLFSDKTPHDVWENTHVYSQYPAAYMNAKSFANYEFVSDVYGLDENEAYIVPSRYKYLYQSYYNVNEFGNYIVVSPRQR